MVLSIDYKKNRMPFCPGCGEELPSPDADVCTHCGRLVKEQLRSAANDGSQTKRSGCGICCQFFLVLLAE